MEQKSFAQIQLKKIYDDGFNIYQLINRVKKQLKRKDNFPEEVILGVCTAYWKDKAKLTQPWPWFVKVLSMESSKWHANVHIKENEQFKKEPVSQALKDIMKGMFK